ncbi:hypothetical protein C0J52_14426 [Blattella germanica]|nr:hypothetical protein C0J52_14426 [Blattella germanica]
MALFGLCPETEKFEVIVCEVCQQLVKPQALRHHYDRRHPSNTTDALPPPEPPEKVSNTKSGSSKGNAANKLNVTTVKAKVKRPVTVPCIKTQRTTIGNIEETSSETEKLSAAHLDSAAISNTTTSRPPNQTSSLSISAPSTLLQPVVALTPLGSPSRTCSSPPIVVKSVHAASTSTTSLKSTHLSTSQTGIKLSHASSAQSIILKPTPASASTSTLPTLTVDSPSSTFPTPGPAKKRLKVERKCLPVKEREYDPDKHCGVWNGESKKPCTRSLTCKSHTLSMRRAVSGRSKHFDKLLADHKAAKDTSLKSIRSSTAQQSTPMEVESNQALSPPPPGRVGGSIQLDIPASPLPTSLSTPMSSSIITPNTTPLSISAPNPSATATPFLGTLAAIPLPSLPDLTEDNFKTHSVPTPVSKAPLLSSISLSKDSLGLAHSTGPPQASVSIAAASQPPSVVAVSTSLPSAAVVASVTSISAQPSHSPSPTTASITMELGFVVPAPLSTPAQAVTLSSPPATRAPITASSTVPLSISIHNPVIAAASGTTHGLHTNGTNVHTHALAAVQMCDFQTLFEDVSWLKHHPRPLAVCTFSGRKVGALVCNTRRSEGVREGLREALTHGPVRSPHSNDFYANSCVNSSGCTLRPVLTNICAKGSYLSPSGKILIPALGLPKPHKGPLIPNPLHSLSPSSLTASGAVKATIPAKQLTMKTTVSQGGANKEASKNGHFHVPNILSGSLKRHAETSKSGGNANSKRTKRKQTQNVNPAEIIGSLLARKTSRMPGRTSHVPLVTVAIANGLGNASTSTQSDTNDSKNVRSSIGTDSLRSEVPKGIATTGTSVTDGTTSVTNVKAVSPNVQNVRIAAAPSTVQLATPQITYLTTGPVTFQQIPVLSPQVISQIQLQSKSGGAGQSIPLKLLSGSGGVSLATATAATATRTMVLHQDKDRGSSES